MNSFIKESIKSLDTQLDIIQTCISRLADDDIWKKFRQETNSIGNLCLHLAGSEYAFIVSIIGGKPFIRQRSKEFTDNRVMDSEQLIENLILTRQQSKEVIANFDFNDLEKSIQMPSTTSTLIPEPGKVQSCLSVILYAVEHYAYHTGQIVYMTKLLQMKNEHILKWRH
ncbi:DinB family protein [Priestia aryabhattai]|uniref:DinB family protein n=1 Tax=Priestia aryabhattai TaxID=412384 RepID=A0ABD7WRU3_PRIAR|nr:DinB family protein [Priestia aryabhattai]WEA42953.1 DinB family protein [Priestia aryabhattai]